MSGQLKLECTSEFHPAVAGWFDSRFGNATDVQMQSWPAISSGSHTLLAAPTGSGKTLAAFLASINSLIEQGLERGLDDTTYVLYISPLKALSNDIEKNLQEPLLGIRDELLMRGLPDVDIRTLVRTGDTPQSERDKARRKPPHILVTTPESVYILLTSESGRRMLESVRTVIVDEIHAMAGNKRGSHLSLSLERLDALRDGDLQRVGLSATQKPIGAMADFLIGERHGTCKIIDTGHKRDRDLALELPQSPLSAVMANEVWQEIYDRLHALIDSHRGTLVFVNTRRLAERAAKFLAERIGEEHVMCHHGSMAKEHRLLAETRLKNGELRCLIATASLELGIDIGDIDLVCQLGSPKSIAAFLQRVGRSGHSIDGTPKGRLFPLSRDELIESIALLNAARCGELDRIPIPIAPLDVLAQQIVAEVSGVDWDEQALFECFRRAHPYRALSVDGFNAIVRMLANGFSTRRGRRAAHIHYDAVNKKLRARKGARLTAITNGGSIPDQFDYEVVLSPDGLRVGSLNEDFAFESMPGDIFQLGNTSYRVLKVEPGTVHVADAHGEPPSIPFWFGEAPGRTDELSLAVSSLRQAFAHQVETGATSVTQWLFDQYNVGTSAAEQAADYLGAAHAALGTLPTHQEIVFERFFDETGDMHLVIHSPFGSRVNRAWGFALRKRFCRQFNFELQAAALEDSIVLSLSATHSFPLEEVSRYLNSKTAREVLIQAVLDAPVFATHWRWNATIALAVKRHFGGKKSPPYFQRADAEDLIAVVFPDQIACLENIQGEREVPDHPLVAQTIDDCLHDIMDIEGLENLLARIERDEINIRCCDLTAPSPLSQEILNARPYAFLDEAPAEERKTMAVRSRGFMSPQEASELGQLDISAIRRVCAEAWPDVQTPDELHDALVLLGFVAASETNVNADSGLGFGWQHLFDALLEQKRACKLLISGGQSLWVAAERLREVQLIVGDRGESTTIDPLVNDDTPNQREDAIREIVRSRLEGLGPVRATQLAQPLGVSEQDIDIALLALEQEGFAIRGHFTDPDIETTQWCDRRLLARIHRYTIKRLRSEIEPASPRDYMRFLFRWQGLEEKGQGTDALAAVIDQLRGYSIPAIAWESDVLPARIEHYAPDMLDTLCASGQISWLRLQPVTSTKANGPVKNSPITLLAREEVAGWIAAFRQESSDFETGSLAARILDVMHKKGASFFSDIVAESGVLRTQVEQALGELANHGLVTSDHFAGLRALITPSSRRPGFSRRTGRGISTSPFDRAGRWSVLRGVKISDIETEAQYNESLAWSLLQRYGVVFRKVLERESGLPPWRDLLRVYWRLEARGDIRGGRFVQGMAGEQFALPDAIPVLRKMRKTEKTGQLISICAADPLNLAGIILPGEKISAVPSHKILFRDGVPVAIQNKSGIDFLQRMDEREEWQARMLLTQKRRPKPLSKPRPWLN
ncbi:MAG: DEAD/DEAH box helicase [Pseudomonadota bacterium]